MHVIRGGEYYSSRATGNDKRGGAAIQPLSSWFYYGATAPDTLLRELTDQSLRLLKNRSDAVAKVSGAAEWSARVAAAKKALGEVFAPLPDTNRAPPQYKVVATLDRPTYTCQKILYQTRPGFYVPAALWTPKRLGPDGGDSGGDGETGKARGKAPGVLLVSGHTPDGFRSNNLGGR
jgi:hypothetical protein